MLQIEDCFDSFVEDGLEDVIEILDELVIQVDCDFVLESGVVYVVVMEFNGDLRIEFVWKGFVGVLVF